MNMHKQKTHWTIILLSLLGLGLNGCFQIGPSVRFGPTLIAFSRDISSLRVGTSAPDFELLALNGDTVRLSQFKGQPVLLSIGASWSAYRRAEAALLQELHQAHPELVILMVDSKESVDVVQGFADDFGITYPILLDQDGKVNALYQIFAIPTELFIDEEGVVKGKIVENITPELLSENLQLIGITP
jgi:peroxiredoxin